MQPCGFGGRLYDFLTSVTFFRAIEVVCWEVLYVEVDVWRRATGV